ncbi:MAG: glycoside hydrolase family 3 C-terminal domain-containing protein [Actinomycetota bacterium]|nr:glycoside hydrolase family 3 C-terminal domain-containing protein [Actinomycetota bacterium]
MSERTEGLLAQMTIEEKATLMTGRGPWDVRPIERLGIPSLKVTDGPAGARGAGLLGTGIPALCIPCGSALGATWNPTLIEHLGGALAAETRARSCHMLLAPTVNIHRTPLGGRNFECYSEDPYLTSRLAVAYVRGVQAGGVATTTKHFVANDSEFERNSIDSVVPERALREVYLAPFEAVVTEADAWAIMSSYNRVDETFMSENHRLLTGVLRDEWGFDGIVVSDWYGTRSTVPAAEAGLDLEMPGPGHHYGDRLVEAVQAGNIDESVLDAAVRRLLLLLQRTGAFDDPLDQPEQQLDEPDHRALARQAATESMVLLTNNGALPFQTSTLESLAVIGPNAATAVIMGGGSAQLLPQHTTSPLEALTRRLPDCAVRYEPGAVIDRTSRPLPARLLTGPHGDPGFAVEYFDGTQPTGDPVHSGTLRDGRLLHFGEVDGVADPSDFAFSAVATLTPEETGEHTLTLVQAGRTRVLVDGEVIIDGIADPPPPGEAFFGLGSAEAFAPVALEAGQPVEVVVEYSSEGSIAMHGAQVGLRPPEAHDLIDRAVNAAAWADAAVVVVGTDEDWETEGRDRESMDLPGEQAELIQRVAAVNPRTVVVLNAGSPVTTDWAGEVPAVLVTWFGGQEMADALVDVLTGEAEPTGRLPTTFPNRIEDTPAYLNYPGENGRVLYGEGIFVGYRWYDARQTPVAFPFGHGLGYTTFSWGEAHLSDAPSHAELIGGATVTITVPVTNTGDRPGTEVVQCYVAPEASVLARPPKELKGFAKVLLEPGETTEVAIELGLRAFAYYDPGDPTWVERSIRVPVAAGGGRHGPGHRAEAGWYIDPGCYRLLLGISSVDIRAEVVLLVEE